MFRTTLLALLVGVSSSRAADLEKLPANTWVEIKYTTQQPGPPEHKGMFARQGWNKLIYDPDGKRCLFYDRWIDKKHGGYTIYGNCLFSFDPAAARLIPIKIDNWTKMEPKGGGYRTLALPENDKEPTPCPRHVYHAFEYVPSLKSVFLCNGANQTALDKNGKLVGHDLCDGTWRLDLKTNTWSRFGAGKAPPNVLDDSMAYCPDIHSLVYAGSNRRLWILDLEKGEWRKAKNSPPRRSASGQAMFYDSPRKRLLILGGGQLDAWTKKEAPGFRELYAFDPKTETLKKLADAPTAFYSTHLAHDPRHDLFFAVAVFNKGEQPSGMFAYDPDRNAWKTIKTANPIPPHNNWFGWMKLCYDSRHQCLIGMVNEKFFAFRYVASD